jgi:transcriptional regulator with XRE-family HTH domain
MIFYQRIKNLRIDHDKSQAEIAKIIGTSQSYYAQYESGKRSIPFERVITLARYYNVSLDYIAGFVDTPRKI